MKKIIAAAIAAMIALSASAAFAAPIELNGDVKAHYRWTTKEGNPDTEGGKFTFRLNAKVALDENVDFYARFAAQSLTADKIGADFDTAKHGSELGVIDQYGFVFKANNFSYKLGRQGVSITPTALLYSSEGYIGQNVAFLDGLTVNGKSGVTDIQLVAGESNQTSNDDNRVYAVHAAYSPAKNWTLGGTLAKYSPNSGADRKYWGVDASYTLGKANFIADFISSDADDNNIARIFMVNYAFDAKNSLAVINHKTGTKSHIYTDWDPGQKGFYYSYDHIFTKDTSMNLTYRDNEKVEASEADNTSLRMTVTYKF